MKTTGIVLFLVGVVWILQGLGIVGGSFMTGRREWSAIGGVAAAVGIALFLRSVSRPPS